MAISNQVQFVVPISLGFGILFTTLVCLLVLYFFVINGKEQPIIATEQTLIAK